MSEYRIVVPGRPKPKERPRFSPRSGRAFTPKTTLDYEAYVRECSAGIVTEPFEGNALTFIVDVYFKQRNHGDLDNYVKIAQDALNKVAYRDDKQIKHMEGHLHFVDSDDDVRLEITIIDG